MIISIFNLLFIIFFCVGKALLTLFCANRWRSKSLKYSFLQFAELKVAPELKET